MLDIENYFKKKNEPEKTYVFLFKFVSHFVLNFKINYVSQVKVELCSFPIMLSLLFREKATCALKLNI